MSKAQAPPTERWHLRLYVADQTPASVAAVINLKHLCKTYLPGRSQIELIDLLENPKRAVRDQITALPTLLLTRPQPIRRIIGDLSNEARVLAGLHLKAA